MAIVIVIHNNYMAFGCTHTCKDKYYRITHMKTHRGITKVFQNFSFNFFITLTVSVLIFKQTYVDNLFLIQNCSVNYLAIYFYIQSTLNNMFYNSVKLTFWFYQLPTTCNLKPMITSDAMNESHAKWIIVLLYDLYLLSLLTYYVLYKLYDPPDIGRYLISIIHTTHNC